MIAFREHGKIKVACNGWLVCFDEKAGWRMQGGRLTRHGVAMSSQYRSPTSDELDMVRLVARAVKAR